MLLLAFGSYNQHRVLSDKERLEYGDFYSYKYHSFMPDYQGAPFCCVYVGLTTNEASSLTTNGASSFENTFTHLTGSYDIHKVTKHYRTYSGGPLAGFMSGHVAFFVFSIPTTDVTSRHDSDDSLAIEQAEAGEYELAFWDYCLWPTNASRISDGGHDLLAPYTGCIYMVSYDNQYPQNDFKKLAESLKNAVQTNWPDRAVEAFVYEGHKK
jgi:hypothetical protein